MTDEILRKVWKAKDDFAKKFDYDIDAMIAELLKIQKRSKRQAVHFEKNSHTTHLTYRTHTTPKARTN